MSLWNDYADEDLFFSRKYDRFDNNFPEPKKSDKYWKDKRGKLHHIEHMDIAHCEAVIRWLHNEDLVVPDALFKRYNERHKELGKMIRNLDEEK